METETDADRKINFVIYLLNHIHEIMKDRVISVYNGIIPFRCAEAKESINCASPKTLEKLKLAILRLKHDSDAIVTMFSIVSELPEPQKRKNCDQLTLFVA